MTEEKKKRVPAETGTRNAAPDLGEHLQSLGRELENRSFSAGPEEDGLYKIYADRYRRAGQLAMQDSQGQSAALTGGYGSSYAQAAGQQAYDSYLQKLSDAGLGLYDRAYTRWKDQGDSLADSYERLRKAEQTEYDRGQDEQDAARRAQEAETDAGNLGYKNLYRLIADSGYIPSDEELESAGMSRGAAEALRQAYLNALSSGGKSSGGGKSGSSSKTAAAAEDAGNLYPALLAEVRALQAAGSPRESLQAKIENAFSAGRITQAQRDRLLAQYG